MTELKRVNGKRQYLVTYSQCDENIFPTRESFGNMLEREFNRGKSVVKVSHWACCKEEHSDGGHHYHCSVKLNGLKKWVKVKESIQSIYGISVNFSDKHDYYLSAYRYVTKQDENVVLSEGHPNLADSQSPVTKKSIQANKRKSVERSQEPKAKRKLRLSNQDTAKFIRAHKIHSYTELLSVADQRQQEGLDDISSFVFNRTEKFLRELITKTWDMAGAQDKIERQKTDRLDILIKFKYQEPCVCNGEWLTCAKEVMDLNNIDVAEFRSAILENIRLGRAKFRNIFIVGPTNTAKTFILKPLSVIYNERIFENPANHKYGWGGAEKTSGIMLQDFRWHKDLIMWKDFLLLLEGEKVRLPAPRNIYKDDICICGDVSIFATGKCEIKYSGNYNTVDEREDEMMKSRWKIFKFKHQFSEEVQKNVKPCGHCFANFVL